MICKRLLHSFPEQDVPASLLRYRERSTVFDGCSEYSNALQRRSADFLGHQRCRLWLVDLGTKVELCHTGLGWFGSKGRHAVDDMTCNSPTVDSWEQ